MTPNPTVLDARTPLPEAARIMRDGDIGDVLVADDGVLCGIVTDRDLVVRGLAEHENPASARLGDICSRRLVTVVPTDTLADAIRVMRDEALRRLPVVRDGTPVGIVSLGDLAVQEQPNSVLAGISSAPANT